MGVGGRTARLSRPPHLQARSGENSSHCRPLPWYVPLNRQAGCLLLSLALLVSVLAAGRADAAGRGARAEFIGGTQAHFTAGADGRVHTTDAEVLVFASNKAAVEVPYENVNLLEYGQQVGRRYLLALAISPMLLLSKSRQHFLTVGYKDGEDRQQALVLRVHKDDIRALLASLEARTGLRVAYLDGEARQAGGG